MSDKYQQWYNHSGSWTDTMFMNNRQRTQNSGLTIFPATTVWTVVCVFWHCYRISVRDKKQSWQLRHWWGSEVIIWASWHWDCNADGDQQQCYYCIISWIWSYMLEDNNQPMHWNRSVIFLPPTFRFILCSS